MFQIKIIFLLLMNFSFSWADSIDEKNQKVDMFAPKNPTLFELTPTDLAPYLLDTDSDSEKNLNNWQYDVIQKVKPYIVSLKTYNHHVSGIIVGYTPLQQPLVLVTATSILYDNRELRSKNRVYLDGPLIRSAENVADKNHVMFPEKNLIKSPNSNQGWYGVPVFHPPFMVSEGQILYESSKNFGLYVMTTAPHQIPQNTSQIESIYSYEKALATPFDSLEKLPSLSKGVPQPDNQVLVMGQTYYLEEKSTSLGESKKELNYRMSYVSARILNSKEFARKIKKHGLQVSPKDSFFIDGEVDVGMLGAGVFNSKGKLIGIVTRILRDSSRINANDPFGSWDRSRVHLIGAVVLRVDHIFNELSKWSHQNTYAQYVSQDGVAGLRCRQLF